MPLFAARPPIDAAARDWVEDSLHLLASEFGRDAWSGQTVLPTDAFFPEPFSASLDGGRALLRAVGRHAGTSLEGIELTIVPARGEVWLVDDRDHEAAPSAPRPDLLATTLAVELDDLAMPDQLVGLFARELCGMRLQDEAGILGEADDFGMLADLLAAFLGLGVFTASLPEVPRLESERRPPALPHAWLGYALAHRSWHADEARPAWGKLLSTGVRANYRQGLRWLRQSGVSQFPLDRGR